VVTFRITNRSPAERDESSGGNSRYCWVDDEKWMVECPFTDGFAVTVVGAWLAVVWTASFPIPDWSFQIAAATPFEVPLCIPVSPSSQRTMPEVTGLVLPIPDTAIVSVVDAPAPEPLDADRVTV
jgi:hypothetical protein